MPLAEWPIHVGGTRLRIAKFYNKIIICIQIIMKKNNNNNERKIEKKNNKKKQQWNCKSCEPNTLLYMISRPLNGILTEPKISANKLNFNKSPH